MITDKMLRTDLPEIRETEGYTNSVLALVKPSFYSESNTYLAPWQVVNTVWYNKYYEDYLGWIELQEILPPEEVR